MERSRVAVIELRGVVRRFGDVTALDGIDLEVAAGEVVGLLGHNGAGKTTTVRTIAGLLPPDEGTVRVAGLDPATDGTTVRRQLGVLPAKPIVDGRLTARANLRFAADAFGVAVDEVDARIEAALDRFELADRADERVGGFSTGMRQRLSLARVLLTDPPILLLDEPTSALDPVAARGVRDLLATLAFEERRTVVVCTHDLTEAERLCDRIVVLERGRVAVTGTPAELRAQHGSTGVAIEVPAGDVDRAIAAITAVVDVEVLRSGRDLHLPGLAPSAVPVVVRALVTAGVDVHQVRRLEATLEDVYLALHRPGSIAARREAT